MGTSRPLMTRVGTELMPTSVPSLTEASTLALISGVAAHAETFAGSSPALMTALLRVRAAPSGVARPSWPSNTAAANWKKAVLPPMLVHAEAVLSRLHGRRMDGRDGKVLKDDARLGKIRDQLVHVGLRLFAVRALEVGELHQLQILRCRAAIRAVGALLHLLADFGEGMIAKVDDALAADDVLAVGQHKKRERSRAFPCPSCRR